MPSTESFDAFIETAWSDHGEQPQEVADRLAASLHRVQTAEHVPPFARLVVHVFGEHLGQWRGGVDVLESLRRLPAFAGSATAAGAVTRSIAALRHAGGERNAMEGLAPDDQVSALATAASALCGRMGFKRAIAAYSEALELARGGLPAGSPALRALAVGGNNLAAALEEKKDRDASETRGMIVAAQGGLHYWKLAGTWLEEERALYRLARSQLQAGEPGAAIRSAERCIAVCRQHSAPAFEQFFGYEALAMAQRAAGDAEAFAASRGSALELVAQVPAEERHWLAADLREIGG
jgi:hypothetical protein